MGDEGRSCPQGSERALARNSNTLPGKVERVRVTSLDRERRSTIELESDEKDMDPEGENDDRSLGMNVQDYSIYSRRELEKMFEGYTEIPVVVPSEVLHCRIILTKSMVEDLSVNLGFPRPYKLRVPEVRERVCFPRGC